MVGCGLLRIGCVLAICSLALAESELEKRLAREDVRSARRFASLAMKADKTKQRATARRLFERVLALDPANRIARGKLGFKKQAGEWARSSTSTIEVLGRKDADMAGVESLRAARRKLEARRAKDILKLAAKYGTPETSRPHLLAVLRFDPRNAAVHEALGHEKIEAVYVRPELTDFVRAMPQRLAVWKKCAEPVAAFDTGLTTTIPGVKGTPAIFKIGQRTVATGLTPKETLLAVSQTEYAHKLIRALFGESTPRWDPPRVYFLREEQYKAYLESRIRDEAERMRELDSPSYFDGNILVERVDSSPADALDSYAHGVLYRSMAMIVSPQISVMDWDMKRYPWFKEGVAAFGTLELLDSADTWFISLVESSSKVEPSLPLPDPLTRDSSIAYIREQFYDGTLPPIREVFGKTLNNLDLIESIYASTLVRFLALYDPRGFRAFPKALREEKNGAQADAALRALEKAFGKPADELMRLWQAYLLELT